ncbi:TetR family transcriptional regulator C-terminal domain-containing protein [Amnibacterium sp.]|uniref:TetR family transcriptional regulator C-terminal domain-containing protein n=1 Tax=Amnibacterium sp. TaxID=1872496 RepID=UPI003F7B5529
MLGRRRARTVTSDEIADAAVQVLGAEGPMAVTRRRLAEALGMQEQDLHVDLDEALAAAYRTLSVAESARVKREVLANPSPVEQMRALLAVLATPPDDNSDAFRIEAWALSRTNPALREAVCASATAWHDLVAAVIRRGARSGQFIQADADEVAAHVISLVEGINSYQVIGYRSDFDRMRLLVRVLRAELGMAWGVDLAEALT